MKVKLAILILVLLFLSVFFAWGLQTFTFRIPSTARVKTVGLDVFADANLTMRLTFIEWGEVWAGENVSVPIYVLSTSNVPIFLWLSTENWVPLNATSYISLSWDYDGSLLQPDESVPLVLTLTVSANITSIESFTFDIVIIGEG